VERKLHSKPKIAKVVLLPGMDGTGDLFGDFIAALRRELTAVVARYPREEFVDYGELLARVLKGLPKEPFVVVAESFSTPLAIMLAATAPKHLTGVVLCAGFVASPLGNRSAVAKALARSAVFRIAPPERLLKRFLIGSGASRTSVKQLKDAIRSVSPAVLARRAQLVLGCDVREDLARVSAPLLYLQGSRDAIIGERNLLEIRKVKHDAQLAVIDAPHLILQREPRAAAERIMQFVDALEV
jgi:pimeloyl-[acyl-carrier protein] methyl ester esterase